MKYQGIVVYSLIPLALLSILSLLVNVQAQTNSPNQTTPPQPNQGMNLTIQALMKVNIDDIKNSLTNAKVAIVNGNFEEALTGVRDVETQLLLIDPQPTRFMNDIHKLTNSIARSDVEKSLDGLTNIQITILRAENQIFKAAVADPQLMQQINSMEQGIEDEEVEEVEEEEEEEEEEQVETTSTETDT
jgi:hypothetical protein